MAIPFARIIHPYLIFLFFLKFSNDLSPCNFFLTLKSLQTNQAFKTNYSAETAFLSLLPDVYSAVEKSQLSLLALFDVSASTDMVHHQILLERHETSCCIKELPLRWLTSYLSYRTHTIILTPVKPGLSKMEGYINDL